MSSDDMQSTIQFILEQQAQCVANIQKLEEVQLRDAPRLERLEVSFVQMVKLARSVDQRLDRVSDAQERLEYAQARATEQLAQLAEAQRQTETKLSELTESVQALAEGQKVTSELLGGIVQLLEHLARR